MNLSQQGTWMMLTATLSGLFMFAVYFVGAPWLSSNQFGLFYTLIMIINLSMVLAPGLQIGFAHQAAVCSSREQQRELAADTAGILLILTVLWLLGVVGAFFAQDWILDRLKLDDPGAFWITLLAVLPALWAPVFAGILQGKQLFGWLGWAILSNGLGRFAAMTLVFLLLGFHLEWLMCGALVGMCCSLVLAAAPCRWLWTEGFAALRIGAWFWRASRFAMGPGIVQFMLSVDMFFARARLSEEESGVYGAAGMVGRGIVMLVGPIAAVMFPRLVRSDSGDSGAKLIFRIMLATALVILTVIASFTALYWLMPVVPDWIAALSFLPSGTAEWYANREENLLQIASLIPWFLGAMGLLALANVYLNHLVARREFGKVCCLLIVPLAYCTGLLRYGHSTGSIMLGIAIANATLLAGCCLFSYRVANRESDKA